MREYKADILEGDCKDVLRKFPGGSFDLIFTSPPYADSRRSTYGGIKPDDYVEWFTQRSSEFYRVLSDRGSFVLNIKEKVVEGERHTYVLELILALRKQGWLWTEEYIWHKKNCHPGKWPNRFRDAWEKCIHFTKQRQFQMFQEEVMVPMGDWKDSRLKSLGKNDIIRYDSQVGSGFGKNIANWSNREKAYPSNVLHLATECGNKSHSASFPKTLPEWFIKLFTKEGDRVLDPFVGSGTTCQVAQKLRRHSVGIDMLPEYVELARSSTKQGDLHLLEKGAKYGRSKKAELTAFIESRVELFHRKRLESLDGVSMRKILSRKNPYLFRAKNILTAGELIRGILDAHLSSQEEGLFGTVLEQLAVYIVEQVYHGKKSASEGIDIEFEHKDVVYLIAFKSGPNWGNAGQIARMRDNFKKAKRILGTNTAKQHIVCVNGCGYGKDRVDDGDYLKLCGQEFWELISASGLLYVDIIEPFGSEAKEKNEAFLVSYAAVVNKFVREFTNEYCDVVGNILWKKIVRLSSEKKKRA